MDLSLNVGCGLPVCGDRSCPLTQVVECQLRINGTRLARDSPRSDGSHSVLAVRHLFHGELPTGQLGVLNNSHARIFAERLTTARH